MRVNWSQFELVISYYDTTLSAVYEDMTTSASAVKHLPEKT